MDLKLVQHQLSEVAEDPVIAPDGNTYLKSVAVSMATTTHPEWNLLYEFPPYVRLYPNLLVRRICLLFNLASKTVPRFLMVNTFYSAEKWRIAHERAYLLSSPVDDTRLEYQIKLAKIKLKSAKAIHDLGHTYSAHKP